MIHIESYESELRSCKRCESMLACREADPSVSNDRVVPKPIVLSLTQKAIMLLGQAPGLTEYRSGRPFSGPAGNVIREVFESCGILPADFERHVHSSAIVKCFPGRELHIRKRDGARRVQDQKPSTAMVQNCSHFLEAELARVSPRLLVLLGSFPLQSYVRMRGRPASSATLENYVGTVDSWGERRVVPLPHTSGASRWLNAPSNRALLERARGLLSSEASAALASSA